AAPAKARPPRRERAPDPFGNDNKYCEERGGRAEAGPSCLPALPSRPAFLPSRPPALPKSAYQLITAAMRMIRPGRTLAGSRYVPPDPFNATAFAGFETGV